MKKITSKNCMKIFLKNICEGDIQSQAKGWDLIFKFCIQNGMDKFDSDTHSGIERVISFLEYKFELK